MNTQALQTDLVQIITKTLQVSPLGTHPIDCLRVLQAAGRQIASEESQLVRMEQPAASEDLAFEAARLDAIGAEEELRRAEGGMVSGETFSRRIGVSAETVRLYRKAGQILAVPKGSRNFEYPAWQIHKGQLLPGLQQVLAPLLAKHLAPLSILSFFITPAEELGGGSPLALLRARRVEEALAHADRYGDIGQ